MIIKFYNFKAILLPASLLFMIGLNHRSLIHKHFDDLSTRPHERDLQTLNTGNHDSYFKISHANREMKRQATHVQLPPCINDLNEDPSLSQIDVTYAYEMTIEKPQPEDFQMTMNNAIAALEEAINESLEKDLITSCDFSSRRVLNVADMINGRSLQILGLVLSPEDRLDACKQQ